MAKEEEDIAPATKPKDFKVSMTRMGAAEIAAEIVMIAEADAETSFSIATK